MGTAESFRSTPDKILAETVASLKRMDAGRHLGEIESGRDEWRILQNTLLNIARHKARIDWIIDRLAERRVRARLRRVLAWAVAEMLYAHGLPEPVVADTAVRFVKRRYSQQESQFINAILRSFSGPAIREHLQAAENAKEPHVRLELSPELYKAWHRRFADEELQNLSRLLLEPPPVYARLRRGRQMEEMASLQPVAFAWAPEARIFVCTKPQDFFASEAFRRGDYYVQDPATLMATALLGVKSGESVADLCAAPGGKAVLISEALAGEGMLVCTDRSGQRLRRVTDNLREDVKTLIAVADVCRPPFAEGEFDAVMLDVPCSNTGVIRRRPDVRWSFSKCNLLELVDLQAEIMEKAASLVRAGGRLVYSTCSIEPEENSRQVAKFISRHADYVLAEERQLLPQLQHDGAFAALLLRKA